MKNRIIEIDEILKIIPHRYPFVLVDRVLSIESDSIKAIKNVTINEEFFQGHFPNFPVMPGVLIIEAMAQTAAIFVIEHLKEQGNDVSNAITLFAGADNVKFKRPVRPGDQLVLEVKVVKNKMGIWWSDCTATVDGKIACSATISATVKL